MAGGCYLWPGSGFPGGVRKKNAGNKKAVKRELYGFFGSSRED